MTDRTTVYTLQVFGTVSAPQLCQKIVTRARDDDHVIERAKTMAEAFAGVRWFSGVRVWLGDDVVLATVTLDDKPVLKVALGSVQ